MNLPKLGNLLKLLMIALAVTGMSPLETSAASNRKSTPAQTESSAKKPKKVTRELSYPVDKVRVAALEALAKIGCKIKKDSNGYIEGKRPNKIGLAVGSGGEVLKVELAARTDASTEITVTTKKTFVGIVGQRLWSADVIASIEEILGQEQ